VINFLVVVTCSLHIRSCPIPNGLHQEFPASSKENCENRVRKVIAAYGYRTKDFNVRCEEEK